jgi:hypothetical protein
MGVVEKKYGYCLIPERVRRSPELRINDGFICWCLEPGLWIHQREEK